MPQARGAQYVQRPYRRGHARVPNRGPAKRTPFPSSSPIIIVHHVGAAGVTPRHHNTSYRPPTFRGQTKKKNSGFWGWCGGGLWKGKKKNNTQQKSSGIRENGVPFLLGAPVTRNRVMNAFA